MDRIRRWLAQLLVLSLIFAVSSSLGQEPEPPAKVQEAKETMAEIEGRGFHLTNGAQPFSFRVSGAVVDLDLDGPIPISILTAGHLFWEDDPSQPVEFTSLVITLWEMEPPQRFNLENLAECEPNPGLDVERDLALIWLKEQLEGLPQGLKVGEAHRDQNVWILGYKDPAALTVIQGTVTDVGRRVRIGETTFIDTILIEADLPPEPGMSGSPVVTEEGLVIGNVIGAGEPKGGKAPVAAAPTAAARSLECRFDQQESP